MAQGMGVPFSLLVRAGDAIGMRMSVIRMQDRRPGAQSQPIEWTFQRQVETALYNHGYASSTGAAYRLLQRSGVDRPPLNPLHSSPQPTRSGRPKLRAYAPRRRASG